MLNRRLLSYVEDGVRDSLLRNAHTNQYHRDPEEFDEFLAASILWKLNKVTKFCGVRALDMLHALKIAAHQIRTRTDTSLKQTTIDAILTDFINYVAMACGIDYGMYAKDLNTPSS